MQNIYISLINYNGTKQTLGCLDSLEKVVHEGLLLHVIVVDNSSEISFHSNRIYKNFSLKILNSPVNTGFSGGHNQAISYALSQNADYILVLNNDTIVEKNLITKLVASFSTNEKIGAVVPKIYFAKGHEFHKDTYAPKDLGSVFWYAGANMDWGNMYGKHRGVDEVDHGQYDKKEPTELLTGCCVLFKADVFKEVGVFDERYFLYYEDADLSMRMKKKNLQIYYVPEAILWHINAGSTGGSGSDLQDYFLSRNRLLFGFTYGSNRAKIALFKESVRLLITGRIWQKKGIQDFFLKKFGKGSYCV